MARREFDAITLRWDVVPNSVASSFTVRQCLVRPVAADETHKVGEEILAIDYELSRSLLILFHGKRSNDSCVISKERNFTYQWC